ncbi:uncharacterized protein LOC130445030 [Diorhabda sublineata]|uniref:uncharacterized protein LOC130445030 n=1 Tax=Diorhabda sublineata TaxID=1163346 RepID=UPI0024E094FB|nr:uncharacterized protein LOC130445030 [Diorhabda sublineata]
MFRNIIFLCLTVLNTSGDRSYRDNEWNGNWFPHSPNEQDTNPPFVNKNTMTRNDNRVEMGISDPHCDDGETNLNIDWDNNPVNYTCLDRKDLYKPSSYIHPVHTVERIPTFYVASHKCMNESIQYSTSIPTFGTHRPLWPIYGEYKFLPKQRWLHNLEHGAVVMLYHPCANKNEVKLLKNLVKGCLFKHIITPYNLLNPSRPLALVTWGHRLEMSKVSENLAVRFIREHALKGYESTFKNGQYNYGILQRADFVSDLHDSVVCPTATNIMK